MIIAVPAETTVDEHRVALVPEGVAVLVKSGHDVRVESGAGLAAGFEDSDYRERGAHVVDRGSLLGGADVVATVRVETVVSDCVDGQVLLGHADPLMAHEQVQVAADRGVTLLALELIPRITRAQSMDVLSSQANLAGYLTVVLAASHMPKIMPLMMTAAGTLRPAKVFVIGVGVAGLQAIATAKRLGAVVSATDIRPATKEQVESVGAKFVFLESLLREGEGGYARELSDEERQQQAALVAKVATESDVVITTASVPGRRAPLLVSRETVESMRRGSVVVDLAAARGGNCALTSPGEIVRHQGVTIVGHTNLPSMVAYDASRMYSGNVTKLLGHLAPDGTLSLDPDDEITAGILVCQDGVVRHERVRERMGLEPLPAQDAETDTPAAEETAAVDALGAETPVDLEPAPAGGDEDSAPPIASRSIEPAAAAEHEE